MAGGLVGHLLRPLIRAVAVWIFDRFPKRRRAICVGMILTGFLLAAPLMGFIWSGNSENMPAGLGPVLLIAAAVGILLLMFSAFLLQEINRMGEPGERL